MKVNSSIDFSIKKKISKVFTDRNLLIEDILDKTAIILSEMVNLTSVVVNSENLDEKFVKINLMKLDNDRALAILVLSNGNIENKIFNFSKTSISDLTIAVSLFNKKLKGIKFSALPNKINDIKNILEFKIKQSNYILQQFLILILSFSKTKQFPIGMQYMLKNPEFNNFNNTKEVIKLIDSISTFEYFNKINIDKTKKINILIGNELGKKEFDDISLISANYKKYKLALIGPKRIDYNKINDILE